MSSEGEYEPALANWSKWLKIHENQQSKLSYQVKRPPQCLVMNSNLNNLYVNQEKHIITEAEKYTFSDKYRGHPHFWKTDNILKDNGKSLGVYQTIQQKYDRSRLEQEQNLRLMSDQREYVGVPEAILKEKGISEKTCLPTPEVKWEKSEYVLEKRAFLKEELKFIQQHRPNIYPLVVVGVPPWQSGPFVENKKSAESTEFSDCKFSTPSIEDTQEAILVMIGNIEINDNFEPWTMCFENCVVNELHSNNMTIKNCKDSCLRYSWTLELPHWINSSLPIKYLKYQEKCFYFDKNNGVILPGCEGRIIFHFQSSRVGVFSESWKLHLSHEPDKWNTKTIEILAVAKEANSSTKNIEAIDSYIESCTRYTIARKVVEEILHKDRSLKQGLPYDWQFFEHQIFIHNNPDLFYDNKCVHVLKKLHAQISKGPWDYSVNNLRRELFENSLNIDLSKELEVYSSTICQLLKPSLPISLLNEKRKSVYELLRCFVNKIHIESTSLKQFIQNYPREFTENSHIKAILRKSSKLSGKLNWTSKRLSKDSSKNTLRQSRLASMKGSGNRGDSEVEIKKQNSDSNFDFKMNMKKQEYLDAMYVVVYHHLGQTIDQISAIIDSFDAQSKKTVLNALKEHNAQVDFLLPL